MLTRLQGSHRVLMALLAGCTTPAFGAITLTISEVGGDVVAAGGGTLDLTAWGSPEPVTGEDGAIQADFAVYLGDSSPLDVYDSAPASFSGAATIGPGTHATLFTSVSGDPLAFSSLLVCCPYPTGTCREIRSIAGFGEIHWIEKKKWSAGLDAATVDSAEIVSHMNDDHSNSLVTLCALLRDDSSESAKMLSVAPIGFHVQTSDAIHYIRFATRCQTTDEIRSEMIRLVREAAA